MIYDGFKWEEETWTYDFKAHFERFKEALLKSVALCFPDYSLDWVLRTDASQGAVGEVLYQQTYGPDGVMKSEVLALLSEKLSPTAQNSDTFKWEFYGIVSSVRKCDYFLRDKTFVVETDHRNLTYMEQGT